MYLKNCYLVIVYTMLLKNRQGYYFLGHSVVLAAKIRLQKKRTSEIDVQNKVNVVTAT